MTTEVLSMTGYVSGSKLPKISSEILWNVHSYRNISVFLLVNWWHSEKRALVLAVLFT